MKRLIALAAAVLLACCPMLLADGFRHPAPEIEEVTMSSPLPSFYFSQDYKQAAVGFRACRAVPIAELAASEARIGGIRVDPRNFSETRENYFDCIQLLDVATGAMRNVEGLPSGYRVKFITWSPSGHYLGFTLWFPDRIELWRLDATAASPVAERLCTDRVNTVFGTPFLFLDDDHILFKRVPDSSVKAPHHDIAQSSVVQEVLGEKKSIRTYQDMMNGPADEELFDYCCTSELAVWSAGGNVRVIAGPAIWRSLDLSPDCSHLIAVTEHHPYSYVQGHNSFPSKQFILRVSDGQQVRMLRDGTVKKEKPDADKDNKDAKDKKEPAKPVPAGFGWRPDMPATLYWSENESGGPGPMGFMGPPPGDDPAASDTSKTKERPEKTFTDKVYQCQAPFDFENDKQLVAAPEYRMGRITWCDGSLALYEESSSKQKFRRTVAFTPCDTAAPRRILFTQSTEVDTLGNFPSYGRPFTVRNAWGRNVLWTDARHSYIYFNGTDRRDSEGFNHGFLDRVNLKDGKAENVWTSSGDCRETFTTILDFNPKKMKLLGRREDFNVVPDYWEFDLRRGKDRQITHLEDPAAKFHAAVTDQYVTYTRKDGLKCFAHLYLPVGYDKERDGKLPVFMWTYPYEFKCFAESEKARPERHKYTKPSYGSAMIWATQGYAVLDEFTMAIVAADKDSLPNDRFLEQLVMSAEAAIDFVSDSLGIGDRDRIGVGGHSYGGYMTANLLAHTRLFRAGIARSGAYNRSLTPFGFQSERRSYWKAKEVYDKMSPFNYADKVKDALMLIHGQQDNNTGTFPVQSERLYQALVYFGATARYVQLPYESHSYQGIETTLDMLYETGAWLDKYVKDAKPRKKPEKKEKPEEAAKPVE
ncbi:MAG: prolyl oligopeptidase family serine peptidase [Bacteroidales bacterium]|nr:prolyl oligopeptidase family serine peptidase [Bacteroidales bacterium]